jgi:hypothetical protein
MLTQSEADALIALGKKRTSNDTYNFPFSREILTIPIISIDGRESFLLDINKKGSIKLTRCTYQERYRRIIILVRLDIDGQPHTNPEVDIVPLPYLIPYNGQTIKCPHLHLYVEDYMDKWAIPAPANEFPNTKDLYKTLEDFFRYCNIIEPPIIQRGLFT